MLKFHRQLGISVYPQQEGLPPALRLRTAAPPKPAGVSRRRSPAPRPQQSPPAVQPLPAKDALVALYQQIDGCTSCGPAGAGCQASAPLVGEKRIRLMIIGDYCTIQEQDRLFGRAEDQMLVKMIGALGLDRDEVYVTNCIKCPQPLDRKQLSQCAGRCTTFLAREIAAVKPRVICAMGDLSAGVVLGRAGSVVRLRGVFHRYRYYEEYPVEVMVTYHPRFLLAHGEMKRATWKDLQQLQQRFLGS